MTLLGLLTSLMVLVAPLMVKIPLDRVYGKLIPNKVVIVVWICAVIYYGFVVAYAPYIVTLNFGVR